MDFNKKAGIINKNRLFYWIIIGITFWFPVEPLG